MFAIIGAGGNVGQATSLVLREFGAPVRAILRDDAKASILKTAGCETAVTDLRDAASVAQAIAGTEDVQVIIPLRSQSEDPVGDMRRCADGIIEALKQTKPKRVLLISDYGAHVDRDIGMPSLFHGIEKRFHDLGGHVVILRSAEHMHNWARSIPAAIESGTLMQFQDPVDMAQPTIAAKDLGRISAEILGRSEYGDSVEVLHAEGPCRYSAADVAAALSELTGKSIQAVAVPRAHWEDAFAQMNPELAGILIRTNEAKNEGGLVDVGSEPREMRHGRTELIDALKAMIPGQ